MSESNGRKGSKVWKYYSKITDNRNAAQCNLCTQKVETKGNTSNLWKHLRAKHVAHISSSEENNNEPVVGSTENEEFNPQSTSSTLSEPTRPIKRGINESTSGPKTKRMADGKINDMFESIRSYEDGGKKNAALTNALLFMIAADDLPLRTSEKRGFKKFCQVAAPLYKPPSRKTVTRLMEEKYKTLSEKVKHDLSELKSLSLTTDAWTESNTARSYLGLTVHYPCPNEPAKLLSIDLGCFHLDQSHTAEYLESKLSELCTQWCIETSSISAIVSDNAANIVKAIKNFLGASFHLPCFGHTIQLVPTVAFGDIPSLKDIIDRVKKIVAFFKKSNNAADELRRLQIAAGKTEGTVLMLLQEEPTRWNTTFFMLERFVFLSPTVSSALFNLRSAPEMLSATDRNVIVEVIDILRPIEQVTRELCSEQDVSCSKVIPIINCLKTKIKSKEPITEIGMFLQMRLVEEMDNRFRQYTEIHSILVKATLLDPRFKKLHFDQTNARLSVSKAIRDISNEIKTFEKPASLDENVNISVEKNDDVWSFHDEIVKKKSVQDPDELDSVQSAELRNYFAQDLIPRHCNPLQYWEERKYSFPSIYSVAKCYLSIPATSVPCERLFSKAAVIDTARRNRLNADHLSQLLFLSSIKEEDWGF